MGIVAFAFRYRHTFYVLALMMLFLGSGMWAQAASEAVIFVHNCVSQVH